MSLYIKSYGVTIHRRNFVAINYDHMVLSCFFIHLSTAYRMNAQILLILDIRVTWRFMWVSQRRHITELTKL